MHYKKIVRVYMKMTTLDYCNIIIILQQPHATCCANCYNVQNLIFMSLRYKLQQEMFKRISRLLHQNTMFLHACVNKPVL